MALLPERTPVIVTQQDRCGQDKRALLPRIGEIAALREFVALIRFRRARQRPPALMRRSRVHLPEGPALYNDDGDRSGRAFPGRRVHPREDLSPAR
jgi:hypothetical protein